MKSRTYLVTGASRGLGAIITRRLLSDGHRVLAISRHEGGVLPELQEGAGERLRHLSLDLGDLAGLRSRVFTEWIGKETPVDGLVNNAAMAVDDLVTNLDPVSLERLFRVNVYAPMELTRGVLRNCLLHKTCGSLVHISSVCAHTGYKGLAMYAATKGALEAFSKNVAREWGARGIRSNAIVCGFMETDMNASLEEAFRERIYRRTALGSPTDPESVAAMVAYLLSDEARSVTGQSLPVDSGTL
ncbi:MAG TPA: SDR family oxidoreductase [Oceanipulchritudo sp.]|nr:SDR family oxidoreductase [Oceanipulchritudo sp.]